MFEIGRTYKFSMNKQHAKNSIYTITVEGSNDKAVWGIDKENIRRGLNLRYVYDWIEDDGNGY